MPGGKATSLIYSIDLQLLKLAEDPIKNNPKKNILEELYDARLDCLEEHLFVGLTN